MKNIALSAAGRKLDLQGRAIAMRAASVKLAGLAHSNRPETFDPLQSSISFDATCGESKQYWNTNPSPGFKQTRSAREGKLH